ncbi:mitotic fidelity of chromosome transmission- protein [Coemansia sp. RSA 353]|nr:mitotic fidelity of chromosome transmission- protein [Coemansia sp. RSA 788]KAJ2168927.1 mitotic fidelity of chromosome transmission- protein [Coemansia sp. RSA 562]KAJ2191649.1 mitotic fidelity of chromosome transmission- protein [Coemansia sp. RSA 532]KAJ2200074.1 mitotic fidelity of chromosome transmission- protein [Coemansia sp. RSA 530]KAJ2201234.1 mitotic fidelity of chromosome transmission- protein [Coemansia sp. RSA 522]KAJ2209176.1 mitotic fidelity of chromosome transmission- prote
MSHALRRAKSPATRNRFNDIGVTGRKTGVRVAGNVLVDDDGLENVDEFYKHTSPLDKQEKPSKARLPTQTLHTLVSPTPTRSTSNYDTLVGALEMPNTNETNKQSASKDIVNVTPVRSRVQQIHFSPELGADKRQSPAKSTRAGNRRTTLAPSQVAIEEDWVRSPKRGRRVTMAFAQRKSVVDDDSDVESGVVTETVEVEEAEEVEEDPGELTSATVIENDESADRDLSDEDDGPRLMVDESYSDVELSDHANDAELSDHANDAELSDHADDVPAEPTEDLEAEDVEAEAEDVEAEDVEAEPYDANEPQDFSEPEEPESVEQPSPQRAASRSKSSKSKPTNPTRRSSRATVQPLAFWRNEHIEYEYSSGPKNTRVPKMTNIVRVRQTTEEKAHAKRRRVKSKLPTLSNIKRTELDLNDRGQFYYYDDASFGFSHPDDKNGTFGPLYVSPEKRVTEKRKANEFSDNDDIVVGQTVVNVVDQNGKEFEDEVAISRHDIEWTRAGDKKNKYQVGVGLINHAPDGTIDSSSGLLTLAVRGTKPARQSGDKAMFYLVTSGQVEVHLHATKFRVGVLGQFVVPRFNTYSIKNVGTHPAQLYYVHICSPVVPEDDDGPSDSE